MFHATMRSAIEGARTLAQLDSLSLTIWQAHAAETVTDAEAQGLAEALHTRRSAIREAVVPVGILLGRVTLFPPKRLQLWIGVEAGPPTKAKAARCYH
jgi:hypothetical protein